MRIAEDTGVRTRMAGLAVLILLAAGVVVQAQSNRNLKILYAGRPGSDREKDFVAFLKEHFDTVRTGNLETFKEADTQGFDVTLLDWDWNEFRGPRPMVSQSFSRPLITLGVAGGLAASQWGLKTGYL